MTIEKKLTEAILKEAKSITERLTGDDKFYALRKIEAAERAGTLKAATTAADDIVMIAEKSLINK